MKQYNRVLLDGRPMIIREIFEETVGNSSKRFKCIDVQNQARCIKQIPTSLEDNSSNIKNKEEKRAQDLNNLWYEINDFTHSIRLNNEYPLINQHFPNLTQKVVISEEDLTDDDD